MKLSQYRKRLEAVMLSRIPRKKGEELFPWRYIDGRKNKGLFELVFEVPVGFSALDIQRQADALYASCGAPVEVLDYAGAVLIRISPEGFPESIPFREEMTELSRGKKEIVIGFDMTGEPVIHSLRVPHVLIAGQSGYGKTDIERWILYQLIAKNSPDEMEIWIVDLKGFSFMPFKNVPHIPPGKIARDLAGAKTLLSQAVEEMERRAAQVWESEDRSLTDRFKTIFVLVDEAYLISPNHARGKANRELCNLCDSYMVKLSSTGREAGVGLIYCTQRPDAETINPLIKANMDCTLAFRTKTESNSLVILDQSGAEKLPHKKPGRLLYATDSLLECQVPYIGKDEDWSALLEPFKSVSRETNMEEEKENENERGNFKTGGGSTIIYDGECDEVFFGEWESIQAGKRGIEETGSRKADRGQAARDRQNQALEINHDWTGIFRDK